MFTLDLHWPAVAVAVAAGMLVGSLWYGPLFGKYWMRLIDKKADELKKPGPAMTGMLLLAVLQNIILANLVRGAGPGPALVTALLLWGGFIVPLLGGLWLFENRPAGLVWLPLGNQLLTILASAAILAAWTG